MTHKSGTDRPPCFQQVKKGNGYKYQPASAPPVPERCSETGAGFSMGGPFWAEPLHNMKWVQGVLQHVKVG